MLKHRVENFRRPRGSELDNQGFTFIEVIVALVLMSTLVAVFGMGLVAAMKSFDFSRANGEVVQKGQLAMARIIRELTELTAIHHVDPDSHFIVYDRTVQSPEGSTRTVTYGLQFKPAAKPMDQQLILFSDIPGDTATPPEIGGDLLCDGVSDLTLLFYQGEEAWTLSTSAIALLSTIEIELKLVRPDAPDMSHSLKTLIHLRNTGNQGGAL